MWHVVIDFKDCTLTFNTGFYTKAIDYQVTQHRDLTLLNSARDELLW